MYKEFHFFLVGCITPIGDFGKPIGLLLAILFFSSLPLPGTSSVGLKELT